MKRIMLQKKQDRKWDEFGYPLRPDTRRQLRDGVVHTSRRMLLACIAAAMSVIGAWLQLGRLIRRYGPLAPARFYPRRILVIRLDLIGDLVLTLPLVQALKKTYPSAEIDLLATPASARVVATHPDLCEIMTYDPN